MNWIRVSVGISEDPRTHQLAEALGVRVAEAGGLMVFALTKFPAHAPTGNLAKVPDSLLELWAVWEGKRGAFAKAFRETFLDAEGCWASWEKHNGNALQKLARDRERIAAMRGNSSDSRATVAGSVAGSVARPSRDSRAVVAGTDGRTDEQLGAHARGNGASHSASHRTGAGQLVPIRPHLPAVLVAAPWCAECGEGEAVLNGKGRIVGKEHLTSCSHYVEPAVVAR